MSMKSQYAELRRYVFTPRYAYGDLVLEWNRDPTIIRVVARLFSTTGADRAFAFGRLELEELRDAVAHALRELEECERKKSAPDWCAACDLDNPMHDCVKHNDACPRREP
jgi:hypothetical protein